MNECLNVHFQSDILQSPSARVDTLAEGEYCPPIVCVCDRCANIMSVADKSAAVLIQATCLTSLL